MAHDVFISYSTRDKLTADAMTFTLESKGIRCWIAPRDVLPGVSWGEAIVDAIAQARIMVLVLSSHANESRQVMLEVERAVSKGIPILPFRIENVPPSKAMELFISGRHWLDALTPPLESHLGKLTETVNFLLSRTDEEGIHAQKLKSVSESLTFKRSLEDPLILVGERVGSYVLQEPIGAGGSGSVYRAWNPALGREVCVKIFHPLQPTFATLAGPIARAVRGLAALNHPHLIKVFDFGPYELADASSFYVAMELVDGKPLDQWSQALPDNDTAVDERLRVALLVAEALQVAHRAKYFDEIGFEQTGVLHGDIKPANVLVRGDNSPVVLDFMMADIQRLLDIESLPTRLRPGRHPTASNTAAFGTPGFMAPEQETKGVVTVKTDIYSLGVTLCYLFWPNSGNPVRGMLISRDSESLGALSDLVRNMLEDNPALRPSDMTEVLHHLARAGYLAGIDSPDVIRILTATLQPDEPRKSV